VWFVDLRGNRHRMSWDPSALRYAVARYREQLTNAEPGNPADLDLHSYQESIWQGNGRVGPPGPGAAIMLLFQKHGTIQIDVQRRTISYDVARTVAAADNSPGLTESLRTGAPLPLVKLKDVAYRATILEEKHSQNLSYFVANIEAHWPVEGKAKVVLHRAEIVDISRFGGASPNGLYAVVKYQEYEQDDSARGSRIGFLVVDNSGNLVDRLVFYHIDKSVIDPVEPSLPKERDRD
jgi:hypothetical protein